MNPQIQRQLKLPLTFVTFAILEGKMFRHRKIENVFVLKSKGRRYGSSVVYGAVFLLSDSDFYLRILDAYHSCSLNLLMRNHVNDLHHRELTSVVPIHFSNLDDLSRLRYTESGGLEVMTYFGNPEHSLILGRINKTNSYRISDGLDSKNFIKLYEEVSNEINEPTLHGRLDGFSE